jgi:hypothetical protein
MWSPERTAILSAAAQIAKRRKVYAPRRPERRWLELHLSVMQDLLEGLLHLGVIVRQQVPNGPDPTPIVRSQTRLTIQEQQGRGSDDAPFFGRK